MADMKYTKDYAFELWDTESKLYFIKGWLRDNGDYRVVIDIHGIYGLWVIVLSYQGVQQKSDMGKELGPRLDFACRWITGVMIQKKLSGI